jgi:TDG/mug DNA glycosylase family protein
VLPDHLDYDLDIILVGINPGERSNLLGHHFAGRGNKFWTLIHEAGLVPRPMTYEDDSLLPGLGIGLTNIVGRVSRGSAELERADYEEGRRILVEKLTRYRPKTIGFVGVTVFREFWPELSPARAPKTIDCGPRPETFGATGLFVLPNPSGRNAHYSYEEMLRCWRRLKQWMDRHARAARG